MLGPRKQFKAEDRAKRRSQRGRASRTKGTDKPSTKKPGVFYSSKFAELKSGALFKHSQPPIPDGALGHRTIPLKLKYRPVPGA